MSAGGGQFAQRDEGHDGDGAAMASEKSPGRADAVRAGFLFEINPEVCVEERGLAAAVGPSSAPGAQRGTAFGRQERYPPHNARSSSPAVRRRCGVAFVPASPESHPKNSAPRA